MHLPEIDKYAHLESPFHSWDPRLKLISMLGLIFLVVLLSKFWPALTALGLALALVLVSRIPLGFVGWHLRWVFLFISFLWLIMPLTAPGPSLVKLGPLTLSLEGIRLTALISLKALAAVLLVFPMVSTMEFSTALKALDNLKLPNRLIQMIMFTYRYIFLLIDEVHQMSLAMESRGFEQRTNLYTLRMVGNLVGMLFVKSYERTERVYWAMVSRGYGGNLKVLGELKVHRGDVLKAGFISAIAVGLKLMEMVI